MFSGRPKKSKESYQMVRPLVIVRAYQFVECKSLKIAIQRSKFTLRDDRVILPFYTRREVNIYPAKMIFKMFQPDQDSNPAPAAINEAPVGRKVVKFLPCYSKNSEIIVCRNGSGCVEKYD